jgi:predicted nucleic acid-binding protein
MASSCYGPLQIESNGPVTVMVDASSLASLKRRRLDAPLLTADRRLAAAPGLGVPVTLLPV